MHFNMKPDRRQFLKLTGTAAGALAIQSVFANSLLTGCTDEENKKLKRFGLQLWTLRDDMAKDARGVLKQVAGFGYKQIESFEGKDGMFWGMSPGDFKKYMDDLGMTIIASHCDINTNFEKKAADAAAVGMKYLICPYKGPQKTMDAFKKFADEFNQKGEICKKNGIRFAYHNHDYSFVEMEGKLGQDVMMQNTDPSLVDFELDMYWVVTGGHDPIAWLKKYPNRFRLCHVKDRMKDSKDAQASCILGEGTIDYGKILKEARKQGMQYFVVEQERYDNCAPLKCVEADAAYMRKVKI
jgi:sugar phosphate isomerase/epimerase